MKFEYDMRDDALECMAFIDGDGDLCIKDSNSDMGVYVGIVGANDETLIDYMSLNGVRKRFYSGDKITITL